MLSKTNSHDIDKRTVEMEVITAMRKQGYTLNAVNNYDENLLHVSAANDCFRIVKEILNQKENCHVIDRKNKFGWTPLMQAIRNGNIDTVKLLLEKDAKVDKVTYLGKQKRNLNGMSILGLAAAISQKMFETVYNACPDALANAVNDDITPLCIAAMKNDKELFFRLLELGMPLSTNNEYTRIMMKRSTIPEIAALVNEDSTVTDDYWNDTSDNIPVIQQNIGSAMRDSKISKNKKQKTKNSLNLSIPTVSDMPDLISPNLTYDVFVLSPNVICFEKDDLMKKPNMDISQDEDKSEKMTEENCATGDLESSSVTFQRFQSTRPNKDFTTNFSYDLNGTLGFTPEFSPIKSPNVPPDVDEENVFGENTPTPPRCKTPPKGMLLNWSETKMIMILRRFGLSQHIPIFLEQEIDVDLFLTLTNRDLMEIGVEYERDRCALLEAIEECKKRKTY